MPVLASSPLARDLLESLETDGWQPGAPPQVTAESVAIDKRTCSRLRCPGCRRRGMRYSSWHWGGRYKVVAICLHCGAGDQV